MYHSPIMAMKLAYGPVHHGYDTKKTMDTIQGIFFFNKNTYPGKVAGSGVSNPLPFLHHKSHQVLLNYFLSVCKNTGIYIGTKCT